MTKYSIVDNSRTTHFQHKVLKPKIISVKFFTQKTSLEKFLKKNIFFYCKIRGTVNVPHVGHRGEKKIVTLVHSILNYLNNTFQK